jgi:hypothetical protein
VFGLRRITILLVLTAFVGAVELTANRGTKRFPQSPSEWWDFAAYAGLLTLVYLVGFSLLFRFLEKEPSPWAMPRIPRGPRGPRGP